jgi:subtilase family serine protease
MNNYFSYLLLIVSVIKVFGASNSILLKGSHLSQLDNSLVIIDNLNLSLNLTLTLVTGSLANTQLVSDYYSQYFSHYFTIYDQTEMHVKMHGSVAHLSQVFNTTFVEYKCPDGKWGYRVTKKIVIFLFKGFKDRGFKI